MQKPRERAQLKRCVVLVKFTERLHYSVSEHGSRSMSVAGFGETMNHEPLRHSPQDIVNLTT